MGTNRAPFLTELFLHFNEAKFIQNPDKLLKVFDGGTNTGGIPGQPGTGHGPPGRQTEGDRGGQEPDPDHDGRGCGRVRQLPCAREPASVRGRSALSGPCRFD